MNVQEQIKEWCKDGRFLRYANERMRKEITEVPENHVVTRSMKPLTKASSMTTVMRPRWPLT